MFDPKTFDYNLLRIFDALAREKSVSGAAESLGLSQPAVSNALQRLRIQLDDPLFVRTRHGMEPTAFALALQNSVLAGLAEIRAALSQTNVFDPMRSERTFTLLMNDVGAATVLPAVFEKLMIQAPKINIRVIERDHGEYEDALDSAAADIAVGRVALSESFQ
jgi:DNA-binding transcriptional LysR family regulator